MDIKVNLLGEWTTLYDSDSINGDDPGYFIENIADYKHNNGFIKICASGTIYNVHISNIQWTSY